MSAELQSRGKTMIDVGSTSSKYLVFIMVNVIRFTTTSMVIYRIRFIPTVQIHPVHHVKHIIFLLYRLSFVLLLWLSSLHRTTRLSPLERRCSNDSRCKNRQNLLHDRLRGTGESLGETESWREIETETARARGGME